MRIGSLLITTSHSILTELLLPKFEGTGGLPKHFCIIVLILNTHLLTNSYTSPNQSVEVWLAGEIRGFHSNLL